MRLDAYTATQHYFAGSTEQNPSHDGSCTDVQVVTGYGSVYAQGYVNLKGYGEFDAANRPSGWNVWLTCAISPGAPTTVTPTKHLVTK
jgi:hypothetical protein